MILRAASFFTLLLILIPALEAAPVNIFLKSHVEFPGGDLRIKDVASVEGDASTAKIIAEIAIDSGLYSDGYISRSELRSAISREYEGGMIIYGSGVRIESVSEKNITRNPGSAVVINGGRSVRAVLDRPNIRIEQRGTALRHGRQGDIIPVRLNSGKVISGRVIDSERVELE